MPGSSGRLAWLNLLRSLTQWGEKPYTPIMMKAWGGIASQIEEDGTIHNICVGTMCTEDINYYMNRPFYDDNTHGSFTVMFAGIEIQRLLNRIGVNL